MSERVRLFSLFLLAALLPLLGAGAWTYTSLQQRTRESYARQLDAAVRTAGHRVTQRMSDDARALSRLCARDFVVDQLVLDLAADRYDAQRQGELGALVPPLMRSLGLDALELLDARSGRLRRGRVLAAGQFPGRAGARDPALLDAVVRNRGQVFVGPMRVHDPAGPRDARMLVTGCLLDRDGVQLAVVGGRRLDDGFASALLGPVEPLRFVLSDAEGLADPPTHSREIHAFVDGRGAPAVRLYATIDESALEEQLSTTKKGFALVLAIATLLALAAAFFFWLRLDRFVSELAAATERVKLGDLEATVDTSTGRDFGELAERFNEMTAELRRTQRKLRRAERIAAWRDMGRVLAHEIKNPLSPIQVSIETLRKAYDKQHPDLPEIFDESTTAVLEEVSRLKHIVSEFGSFARMPRPKPVDTDVGEILEHVAALHRGEAAIDLVVPDDLPTVRADREQLTQVVVNLVKNGIEAARAVHGEGGARIDLSAEARRDGGVTVRVSDNGPGIPPETRERIFDPYFTTKSEGTGIGLAIVQRIVWDHGATIEVGESASGGAEMVLALRAEGPPKDIEASMTDTALPLVTRRSED